MDDKRKDSNTVSEAPATKGVSVSRPGRKKAVLLTDEEQQKMHMSFNNRISYLCKMAALVIAVVSFATVVLGQDNTQFVVLGLCLSVALLAIAALQDHHQRK